MRRFFLFSFLALVAFATPALAANVDVNISIGAPGYYGLIDPRGFPQPVLVYPEPVIIQPAPVGVIRQPVYLRVPPGHAKHWAKHCARYHACGEPVYFVQDGWYRDVSAPHFVHEHGHGHGRGHDNDDDDD